MATATPLQTKDAGAEVKTTRATKLERDDTFPFLELPPELRVMVYREFFATLPKAHGGATRQEAEPTALFQVCSEVRYEASPAFYKEVDQQLERVLARQHKLLDEQTSLAAKFRAQNYSADGYRAFCDATETKKREYHRLSRVGEILYELKRRHYMRWRPLSRVQLGKLRGRISGMTLCHDVVAALLQENRQAGMISGRNVP